MLYNKITKLVWIVLKIDNVIIIGRRFYERANSHRRDKWYSVKNIMKFSGKNSRIGRISEKNDRGNKDIFILFFIYNFIWKYFI